MNDSLDLAFLRRGSDPRIDKFHKFRKVNTFKKQTGLKNNLRLSLEETFDSNLNASNLNTSLNFKMKKRFYTRLSQSKLNNSMNASMTLINPFLNTTIDDPFDTTILEENVDHQQTSKTTFPKIKPKIFIPQYIFNSIDLNKQTIQYNNCLNDLNDNVEEYYKSYLELDDIEKNKETLEKELKEAKDARNKVMNVVYQLKNEIENKSILQSENNLNMTTIGGNFQPNNTFSIMNGNQNTFRNNGNDLAQNIEKYEDQILKIKMENQSFLEEYDNLNDDLKKNIELNKKLKTSLSTIEQNIQAAVKEKNSLRNLMQKN